MFAAALLLAGCASYSKAIRPGEQLSAGSAYVYGNFFIKAESHALSMDGHQTMGFLLGCADGRKYTIRFSNQRGVQVIRVSPARCSFDEIVFTDGDGVIKRRGLVNSGWSAQLVAGKAYYLGDFFAKASFETDFGFFVTKHRMGWAMSSVGDNYEATTAEMKRTFVQTASLPTEARPLIPAEPSGPASAQGPPISPERTARIAAHTRRRYATPAECRASCPTGQCLPFRGEAGPAMACIVRCKADSECPHGLACNCPKDDMPGCHPIAEEPGDAMEGICLSVERTSASRP